MLRHVVKRASVLFSANVRFSDRDHTVADVEQTKSVTLHCSQSLSQSSRTSVDSTRSYQFTAPATRPPFMGAGRPNCNAWPGGDCRTAEIRELCT